MKMSVAQSLQAAAKTQVRGEIRCYIPRASRRFVFVVYPLSPHPRVARSTSSSSDSSPDATKKHHQTQ
jgi:hypothetical protein